MIARRFHLLVQWPCRNERMGDEKTHMGKNPIVREENQEKRTLVDELLLYYTRKSDVNAKSNAVGETLMTKVENYFHISLSYTKVNWNYDTLTNVTMYGYIT